MIFVSIPYTHADADVVERRVRTVHKYCADLMDAGEVGVSPIIMGTAMVPYLRNKSVDYDTWQIFSRGVLERSTMVHVLMVDGWNTSTGVADEIQYAVDRRIPIAYIGMS